MKIRILLALMLLLLTAPASAKSRRPVRKPKSTAEELARQEKFSRMLTATERIMFIDSFVVNKSDFLRAFRMSTESGSIKHTSDILRNYKNAESFAYLNELGSRCYLTMQAADSTSMLYSCEQEDGQWTKPEPLKGINDEQRFQALNYPFMMGDGLTLYFAAKSNDGLGGYDIYMTTFDSEAGHYLQPVNIGMPFNSEANDYMYAIDEYEDLGWFVTDRRQPKDKVCVYVFEPSTSRQTYDENEYTSEQLASLAQIANIRQTWSDESRLQAALQRLQQVKKGAAARAKNGHVANSRQAFVINDDVTYYNAADFRHPENGQRYQRLLTLRQQQQETALSLDKARNYYAKATPKERRQLSGEMMADEQKTAQLNTQIHELEKTIRNTENFFLTNNK